jgi:P27 family predicted phage terminase small subunit
LPAELGTPPSWLSKPAAVLWRDLVPRLDEAMPADALTLLDVPALALMVEHFVIARRAAELMVEGPLEVDHAHGGQLRKSPASQVMRDHGAAFLALAREYGLTARSRSTLELGALGRMTPDDEDDGDLFAD